MSIALFIIADFSNFYRVAMETEHESTGYLQVIAISIIRAVVTISRHIYGDHRNSSVTMLTVRLVALVYGVTE